MIPKTEVKHTPTPWTNVKTEVGVYSDDFLVGEIGTFTPTDRDFIIRAVNSHEALLDALKLANEKLIQLKVTNTGWPELTKVWKAISQAEGK